MLATFAIGVSVFGPTNHPLKICLTVLLASAIRNAIIWEVRGELYE